MVILIYNKECRMNNYYDRIENLYSNLNYLILNF